MISYLRDGNVKLSKLFEYAKIKDLVLKYSQGIHGPRGPSWSEIIKFLLVQVQVKWFWFILSIFGIWYVYLVPKISVFLIKMHFYGETDCDHNDRFPPE